MRILVVRLDAIGDTVLMSPFLRELRRFTPHASITLLVQPLVFNLVENCPHVDQIMTDFSWFTLWRGGYDLAISPRFDVDHYGATKILWLSFAGRKIRYHGTQRWQESPQHEVERNLAVLRWLGGSAVSTELESWVDEADRVAAARLLAEAGVRENDCLLALGVGARHAAKQWPADKFLDLSRWLIAAHQARLLIVGGKAEQSLGAYLASRLPEAVIDATGRTTLRQASALLKQCRLYVGNDTGLMHMAAAEKVPVVGLFRHPQGADDRARSSPKRFGPWGVPHRIVQPPAGDITQISGHDVQHAVTALIGSSLSSSYA